MPNERTPDIDIPAPYLVYLGDERQEDCCKTGFGLAEWAAEKCLGQLRTDPNTVSIGLPDMSLTQAIAAGARSLVIGIAGVGGRLPAHWHSDLLAAAKAGLAIVSGSHERLSVVPGLIDSGAQLIEIRHPALDIPVGTGVKRPGLRLLTVGTDCALGKKYTALSIAREMQQQGMSADFRATGQTGIMIAGQGIPLDAVVSDFVAGAAEILTPAAAPDHWDVIEGQGSLLHPGYAGVTLGLLHGSQPDEIVLCHDSRRTHNLDSPQVQIPPLSEVIELYLSQARLTNSQVRCTAIALNTRGMSDSERMAAIETTAAESGLHVFDPVATGSGEFIAQLAEHY